MAFVHVLRLSRRSCSRAASTRMSETALGLSLNGKPNVRHATARSLPSVT